MSKVAANRGVTNAFYSIGLPTVSAGIYPMNEPPFIHKDAYHYFGRPATICRRFWHFLERVEFMNLCDSELPPMLDDAISSLWSTPIRTS